MKRSKRINQDKEYDAGVRRGSPVPKVSKQGYQIGNKPFWDRYKSLFPENFKSKEEKNNNNDLFLLSYFKHYKLTVEEEEKVIYLVESRGGTFIEDDEIKFPTFYIMPMSDLSEEEILKRKGSNDAILVTDGWVERCIEDNRIYYPEEHYLFTPRAEIEPIREFKNLKFSTTGFSEAEKRMICTLILRLGGGFTNGCSRKNTHLICKEAKGRKYDLATRIGIKVIKEEWLCKVAEKRDLNHPSLLELVINKVDDGYNDKMEVLYKSINPNNASLAGTTYPRATSTQNKSQGYHIAKKGKINNDLDREISSSEPKNEERASNKHQKEKLIPRKDDYLSKMVHRPNNGKHLNGCKLYFAPSARKHDTEECFSKAKKMGADYIVNFSVDKCTHIIHNGKGEPKELKELNMTRLHNIKVVSSRWILECYKNQERVDENLYPSHIGSHRRRNVLESYQYIQGYEQNDLNENDDFDNKMSKSDETFTDLDFEFSNNEEDREGERSILEDIFTPNSINDIGKKNENEYRAMLDSLINNALEVADQVNLENEVTPTPTFDDIKDFIPCKEDFNTQRYVEDEPSQTFRFNNEREKTSRGVLLNGSAGTPPKIIDKKERKKVK